jgi:hypothetical protein
MRKLILSVLVLTLPAAWAQVADLDYAGIKGKDYYQISVRDPKSGRETHWAMEFLENKDQAIFYQVDGETLKSAASYQLNLDFRALLSSVKYFQTESDHRTVFVMILGDRLRDLNHRIYVFDPVKDAGVPKKEVRANTDDIQVDYTGGVLTIGYTDSKTHGQVKKSLKLP